MPRVVPLLLALAVAFDLLRVAVAQVVHLANERIQKHLWSQFSGLPTGLAARDGVAVDDGAMIATSYPAFLPDMRALGAELTD